MRYLFARRGQFASFITWASLIGLTLGVAVLVVVVSVMNGFDATLKDRILGTVPHVVVGDSSVLRDGFELGLGERVAGIDKSVSTAFRFFEGQGMISRNGGVNPIAIYGIDPSEGANFPGLAESLLLGDLASFAASERGLLIGAPLARHLSLLPGDTVTLIFAGSRRGQVQPKFARFELVDYFEVGAEIDYNVVFVRLDDLDASGLAAAGDMGLRLVLNDPLDAPGLAAQLSGAGVAAVRDWSESYGDFFRAVRLEKAMMFVLLTMVVAIAAFNIVSSQTMLVNDKRGEIAILMTMGAAPSVLMGTFLLLAALLCFGGIAIGLGLGLALAYNVSSIAAWVESQFGFTFLAGTYFSDLPVRVLASDLVVIAAIAAVMTLIAGARPALSALSVNPVAALHRL